MLFALQQRLPRILSVTLKFWPGRLYRFRIFYIADTAEHDSSKTFLTVKSKGQHPLFFTRTKILRVDTVFPQQLGIKYCNLLYYIHNIIQIYSSSCCLYCYIYNEHIQIAFTKIKSIFTADIHQLYYFTSCKTALFSACDSASFIHVIINKTY